MGPAYHPTYWGSMIALLLSMVITGASVISYGMPNYVELYPKDHRTAIFLVGMLLTFLCAARYYCLLSLNIIMGDGRRLFELPPALKRTLFIMMASISLLCLSSAGAVTAMRIEGALAACWLMSIVTAATWLICWTLSHVAKMPKITGLHIAEELLFIATLGAVLFVLFTGAEGNLATSLPISLGPVLLVFGNRLVRTYAPAIRADIGDLAVALNSSPSPTNPQEPTPA